VLNTSRHLGVLVSSVPPLHLGYRLDLYRIVATAGLVAVLLLLPLAVHAQPIPPPTGPVSSNGDYSYNATFTYDPSKCSRDPEGLIYFAVGRRVFRHPFENLRLLAGPTPSMRRAMPQPRHPEEPWGCPDHPLQNPAYRIWFKPIQTTDARADQIPDLRPLDIALNGGERAYGQNDIFETFCSKYKNFDYSVFGFTGCRKQPDDGSEAFLANQYTDPDGLKLAIFCLGHPLRLDQLWRCEAGYKLADHLIIYLKFNPSFLSIKDFPRADAEIRRLLMQSEVPFDWLPPLDSDGKN